MKKKRFIGVLICLLLLACSKNDDSFNVPSNLVVQDFMWKAMNYWYFWQADVPDLQDNAFSTESDYNTFLASEENPTDFYNNQLKFSEDRFSGLSDDYKTYTQAQAGISKSNGLEFGLIRFSESEDIFGYVRYIIPNSDAATKDISRGELFTGANGQTLNLSNYSELLFGDSDTYTLNMADIADNIITPNDKEVVLTKQEGLAENPVFLSKTFDINGQKIGYLVYNGFTNEYDEDLNIAIGDLKAAGAVHFILDMRYNPGGSVNSARLLSSMIYGSNTGDLFLRQRWNAKIQSELSQSQLEDYFADKTSAGTPLNTLDLNTVYVIATGSSASASELVMNGLAPYVNVVHIGETTRGKNEFSIIMVDDVENNYIYNKSLEGRINPANQWAIQPLVGRNENADGFSDYTAGLMPNIELAEDLANLSAFGDPNEPLLARALQEITGVTGKRDFTVQMPLQEMTNSKMFTPLQDNMILDKPLDFSIR